MLLSTKCVFWFSLQLLSETFLIPSRIVRDMIKNVCRSSCKVPVILCQILMKRGSLDRFFEKSWNIEFHENPSSGSRVVPCGRTFGQTWRSEQSLFAIFRTRLQTSRGQILVILDGCLFNNLKPASQFMHQKFNIKIFYVLSTQCIWLFCTDLRTKQLLLPRRIFIRSIFIIKVQCVYCAVRTVYLSIPHFRLILPFWWLSQLTFTNLASYI